MTATLEHRTIDAGGFHTAYVQAGDPDNDTVVLLHDGAFGSTGELCWGDVMTQLATRYHVVAPDLLGWGGTDKVVFLDRSPYAARIAHIEAFCSALGIDKAYFAGASFGGSLVLRAMTTPGASWPVSKAVSVSGAGGAFRRPEGLAALGEYTPSLEAAEKLTAFSVTSTEGLEDHIRQRHENSLIPGHWEALMAPRLSNPSTTRTTGPDTFLEDLAALTTPILLIEGTRDQLMEPGWADKTAGSNPHIQTVLADYAHEPNIDAPQWTAETMAAFFEGPNK